MTPQTLVTLVIPPSPFLLDERVFMSLGILRVAAVLEQAAIPVRVLDLSGVAEVELAIARELTAHPAVFYGLTATTPQMPAAARILRTLKAQQPWARRILGGPHVTLVNAAARKGPGRAADALAALGLLADVLVAGDGERAIFDALAPSPPPLIDADQPNTLLFLRSRDLNTLPDPARHLVDVDSYHYTIDGERALSVIAQLGCPFGCGFCGGRSSPSLRQIRTRSSESVVREVVSLYRQYGVKGFMFYDDELNVSKNLVELMAHLRTVQMQMGVSFALRGFIKAELFTDAQAAAMAAAGFRWILVGFESGDPRILQNINKRATQDDNTRCLAIARRHGLKVKALMSIGHPGESPTTIANTVQWLLAERPDDLDVTIITTYPGTPYYDDAIETRPGVWTYTARSGDRLHAQQLDYLDVADYYKGMPGHYHAYTWTDQLTAPALTRARDAVEATIRHALHVPYPTAPHFDHSMGQT